MKKETRICITVGISLFLLYGAIQLWPFLAKAAGIFLGAIAPVFFGAFCAYLVSLPMGFYERIWFPKSQKKFVVATRAPIAMVLALLSIAAVCSVVVALILPQLVECINLILDLIPKAYRSTVAFLDRHHLLSGDLVETLYQIDWKSRLADLISLVSNGVTGAVSLIVSTVTGVVSGLISAFLSFIFALYILLSKKKLKRQCKKLVRLYLPRSFGEKLLHVVAIADDCFHRYIVGQCMEAVILGVLCAVGMLLLRLPYAGMISALIAFTALIPIAGAYVGAAVGAFMILPVSPLQSLIFLIFLIILQQLEGNLIYPKVVGTSLGLPALWVLAAVTIGGGMLGIMGMFLGVPAAATLYRLLREDVRRREKALAGATPSDTADAPSDTAADAPSDAHSDTTDADEAPKH
ncbi:MAG: AI-2E family transporter [Clostridia bacterium]|nr:AI-2E family transporter [Clostridia bacterium]